MLNFTHTRVILPFHSYQKSKSHDSVTAGFFLLTLLFYFCHTPCFYYISRYLIEQQLNFNSIPLLQDLYDRDYMDAYLHQSLCVSSVVKMLQAQKEENWTLPLMYTVCLDLRLVAQKAEGFNNCKYFCCFVTLKKPLEP